MSPIPNIIPPDIDVMSIIMNRLPHDAYNSTATNAQIAVRFLTTIWPAQMTMKIMPVMACAHSPLAT
jgi:hypothetical protein